MLRLFYASVAALVCGLAASTAEAQTASRAWVSGHGTDAAGCGTPAAPCRSLQYAHDNIVAAGGEIDILDPAGYGAVSITKSISIVNDGVGTAGVQAATGAAVTINAGASGAVLLRGLDIEGVGGSYGIHFKGGASLKVQNCTIKGFTFGGIQYEPTAPGFLYVSNSSVIDNLASGINVHALMASGTGTVLATLSHVEVVNDLYGVFIDGRDSVQGAIINAVLADSVVASNSTAGVESVSTASNATTFLMVRDTTVTGSSSGADAFGGATLYLARSTLSADGLALNPGTGGVIGSYGDNNIDNNINPGPTPTPVSFH